MGNLIDNGALEPPQETHTTNTLGSAAQLSIRLPVAKWCMLTELAFDAGDEFTARCIDAELAHLEKQIAAMLAAVQLPLSDDDSDNGNGHKPDSPIKRFITTTAAAAA